MKFIAEFRVFIWCLINGDYKGQFIHPKMKTKKKKKFVKLLQVNKRWIKGRIEKVYNDGKNFKHHKAKANEKEWRKGKL